MESRVTATEAVRSFSELLNRIRYRGEEFIVERGGEAVCRMSPASSPRRLTLAELARVIRELPLPDPGYRSDVTRAAKRQGRMPGSPWAR